MLTRSSKFEQDKYNILTTPYRVDNIGKNAEKPILGDKCIGPAEAGPSFNIFLIYDSIHLIVGKCRVISTMCVPQLLRIAKEVENPRRC